MKEDWHASHHEPIPKPKNVDGYFESMSRAVFAAGLAWGVVDKKWPTISKAFDGFSVTKVAKYNQDDVDRLMADTGIVRNYRKVIAMIDNAKSVEELGKEFGSFEAYFKSFKGDEPDLVRDLGKRFSFLGPSTAVMFLYGVGEKTSLS